jgi:tetratricopeptide (TPR) repeat protein
MKIILYRRYDEAIVALDQALELDSSNTDAWYDRARSNAKLNNLKASLADLKNAIELGGEDFKTKAKDEKDFNNIRKNAKFMGIVK